MKSFALFGRSAMFLAATLLASSGIAVATPATVAPLADTPAADESDVLGEARITMKFQHVRFVFDDRKEWENHEYVDGGKTLVIKGIERNADHTVVLTPREDGYEPVTLTLKAGDFKRAVLKVKGSTQTITYRANYRVDFKSVAPPKQDSKP